MHPWLRSLFGCLASLLAFYSAHVSAQTAVPADTRIVVSGCSLRVNERAVRDQVRIELLAAGVHRVHTVETSAEEAPLKDEPEDVATLRIVLPDCDAVDGEIRLGVAARRTGRHVERSLAVSDVADSMVARAIALALTELLRSSWYELSTPAGLDHGRPSTALTPPLHANVLVVSVDRNEAARAVRQRLRLEWRAGGRMYPQTDSGEVSSAFGLSKLFGPRTRLVAALSAAGGGGQRSDARLFQTTSRTTVTLCGQSDRPMLEVGGSIELGYARLRGNYAGVEHGFVSTALVHGTLRVQVAQDIETLITLQAGYVLSPVTLRGPEDERGTLGGTVGFKGPVIGLEIGVAGLLL